MLSVALLSAAINIFINGRHALGLHIMAKLIYNNEYQMQYKT